MESFHSGEKEVQERAGVRHFSEHVAGMIRPEIPPVAIKFLETQPYAVVATLDSNQRPWTSFLFGVPGFLSATDERTVEIRAQSISGDPLEKNLIPESPISVLAIDLSTRRRVKIKGQILSAKDPIRIKTERVYSQCPKYIQRRIVTDKSSFDQKAPASMEKRKKLTDHQQKWLASADTFFISTYHPETGMDVSHRGGMPGFVEVVSDSEIHFPDYAGNNMFNTLGNITAQPHTGLLFLDFDKGRTLQMTGRAEVIWSESEKQRFTEAGRIVSFSIEDVVEIREAFPMRWNLQGYSPFNPSPPRTPEKGQNG